MRDVSRFAGSGFILLAALSVAGQARAQVVLSPTSPAVPIVGSSTSTPSGTTYQYGDTTFSFINCSLCSYGTHTGTLELLAVSNGRGGTEIEIAEDPPTSAIYSTSVTGANLGSSFSINVGTTTGSHGISSVTNILVGSYSNGANTGQVASLLESFGNTNSSVTSTLATPSTTITFGLTSAFTFTDALSNNGPTANNPDTLSLNDVKLLFAPAPEPASIAVLATGVMGLTAARRRSRRCART
jgi:hypothetical protein